MNTWSEVELARQEERREIVLSGESIRSRLEKEKTLPASIYSLKSLNFLDISGVGLEAINADIQKLVSLSRVVLRNNKLTELPAEFGHLEKLKHFDVSGNCITSLPDSLSKLSALQHLNVSSNKITSLPDLAASTDLVEVIAEHNKITDFPQWLLAGTDSFIHLSTINLRGNEIAQLSGNMGALSAGLRTLNLSENNLSQVPGELGDCARLKEVYLIGNPIKDRRLLKLVNEQSTRMPPVLDYIRKSCPRSNSGGDKKGGGKGKKKRKGGKSESENQNDGEVELDQILVSPSTEDSKIQISPEAGIIRPHLVCCIVRGVDLEKENAMKTFLQIQNKLHDGEKACNKRVACTIATHDLSKVKFPLKFTAKEPKAILITPLRSNKEMSGKELVEKLNEEAEALRKKEKRNTYSGIHKYLYLLKDMEKYACLEDSNGTVISFPPITNSDLTKMGAETRDLLIEVSGAQDQAVCKRVTDTLLIEMLKADLANTATQENTQKKLSVQQVKVLNEAGRVHVTYPDRNDLKLDSVEIKRL